MITYQCKLCIDPIAEEEPWVQY